MRPKNTPALDRACLSCGLKDARGLTDVMLAGGESVTLCGTHELILRRAGGAEKPSDIRRLLSDRRDTSRRHPGGTDELAERLQAAFAPDRRRTERRAS